MTEKKTKKEPDFGVLTKLHGDVANAVEPFNKYVVSGFPEASAAIEGLKQLKALTKEVDKKRRELVDPLNEKVNAINAYAKTLAAPLLEAEANLKAKVVAFEQQQERIRIEAQRKADEELRRKEEELRQKQQAEQDALNEELDAESEAANLFGDDESEDQQAAERAKALEEKQIAEQAAAFNERAEAEHAIAQQRVTNTRKTWACELVDIELVPKEFQIRSLNEKMVLAAVRANENLQVPGVKIFQKMGLAVGRNTYVPREALEKRE